MHTNTHGYVSKYITYEKACVMDGRLEGSLKIIDLINAQVSYRINQQ